MILAAMLLSWLSGVKLEDGTATIYGYKTDAYNAYGKYACKASLISKRGSKFWNAALSMGVAHRTLPCGSSITVCNNRNRLCASMFVVDRGPYGAINTTGKWRAATRLKRGETYRGVLDLLPQAAKKIKLNGKERVTIWQPQTMFYALR